MNQRDFSVWLVPLLAMLAIYFPVAGSRSPEGAFHDSAPEIGRSSLEASSSRQQNSTEDLLRLFLATDSVDIQEQLRDYEIRFLIATLPDPTDSGLGHLFDAHVAAIQRAAEAAEYVLDRFNVPWGKRNSTKQENEDLVRHPSEIAKYLLESRRLPAFFAVQSMKDSRVTDKLPPHQREPGIVLFRKPYEKSLMLLYLVGETPTTGIHKAALLNALAEIRNICAWGRFKECGEFRLLAPTFSGSADSLKLALEAFQKKPDWKFNVVSGSATAVNKQRFLAGMEATTTLSATVAHERDLREAILGWIMSRHKDGLLSRLTGLQRDAKIALLIEAGTGYGEASREEVQRRGAQITILPYPVHISQVRKTTEKTRASERDATKAAPRTRPRNLKLTLEEGDDAKDILPPFSKFETFSVELVLSDILSTISSEGIRYVGLFSTDVRDQIFLAGEIRKHAPDVILFTVGADLFYLHSDINVEFHGMLLATTYPLFTKNQLWTYPFSLDGRRMQFGIDTALGVYNAAVALLEKPKKMLEYDYPFDTNRSVGMPRKPPIWLTVVGKDAIWPITHFENLDSMNYLYNSEVLVPKVKEPIDLNGVKLYSHRLFYGLTIVAVICVVLSGILMIGSGGFAVGRFKPIRRITRRFPGISVTFGDAVYKRFRLDRQVNLLAFSVGLLIISLIISRLFSHYLISTPGSCLSGGKLSLLLPVLASGPVVLLAGKAFYTAKRMWREPALHEATRCSMVFSLLWVISSPLLILILTVYFAANVCGMPVVDQFFFNLRLLNPGSGLSPLLPLLFVATAALLYYVSSFRRLRAYEELQGNSPRKYQCLFFPFRGRSFAGMVELETDVVRSLSCSAFRLPLAWFVIPLVGGPCVYLFLWQIDRSIEASGFYLLFGVAFVFIYVALSLTLLRLIFLWAATRKILRRLAAHPIQSVFGTLRSMWPSMPRLDLSLGFDPFAALQFSARRLKEVSDDVVQDTTKKVTKLPGTIVPAAELQARAQSINAFLDKAQSSEAESKWRKAINFRRSAQRVLSRASVSVAAFAEPFWTEAQAGDQKKEKPLESAQLYLAARCVTFFAHVFFHLKNLICFLFLGLILMLLAVSSYPFQPREWILWFNWFIILTSVFSTLVIFIQMNRDGILSQLSDTSPGHVTWSRDFISKVLVYGAIPLFALLSAHFPESIRQLLSWFGSAQGGH